MCPITKSRRLHLLSTWLQDLYEARCQTRLPQLALYPSTRQVATLHTPWGNYRIQWLVFAANSSQDVFDEAMFRIFGDIHHCLKQRDDILLGGRNQIEHSEVLKQARDHGITFNREKCQFGGEQMSFSDIFSPRMDWSHHLQSTSRQRVWSAWEWQATWTTSSRILCSYSSTTVPANQKRNQILLGLTRRGSIQKDTRYIYHLKWEDHGILQPKQTHNPPYRSKLQWRVISGPPRLTPLKTDRGIQLVHFISWTMTETEKRYSQTKKDTLEIK